MSKFHSQQASDNTQVAAAIEAWLDYVRTINAEEPDDPSFSKIFEQFKPKNLTGLLHAMRNNSWDLWSAMDWVASYLDDVESDSIQFGSCQNTEMRQAGELCYYYQLDPEVLHHWDT